MEFNYQLRNQTYFIFLIISLAQDIIEQNSNKNPNVKPKKFTDLPLQRYYHTQKWE